MVTVNIIRNNDAQWVGMEISGHAGASIGDEYDLVCSAISFHFQTIVATLEKESPKVSYDVENGFLKCTFKRDDFSPKILQGIENVFFTGIYLLQESYGKFIDVQ